MVAVKFDDLSLGFDFVGSAPPSENNAYISLDTGQIYWVSEFNPLDEERDGSGFSDTEIIDSLASNQEEQDDEQEKTTAETDGEV